MSNNWHNDARFGMFVHFGLYSLLAGMWKGKKIPRIGEQIMRFGEIPVKEYEKVAKKFNPSKFSAQEWVAIAKNAGMKYFVITAKHHDGFALFDTKYSDFNIMNTPFGRDIIRELAEECKKQEIKFCVYYSHRQDWHEEDGTCYEWSGQFEQPSPPREIIFDRYMENKAIPQVKELLSNYGDIGLIWYDTACDMTPKQSQRFYDVAHEMQKDILVCDRVGNNLGEYRVMGDNEFAYIPKDLNGEVPATLNHTWGFKSDDHEWKNTSTLLYSLIRSVANGCNYLLNVGPDGMGIIPPESITRLNEIGAWLKINGNAIYGAKSVPFITPDPELFFTRKEKSIFVFVRKDYHKDVIVEDILSKVERCQILTEKGKEDLAFIQNEMGLTIESTERYSLLNYYAVIELTFASDPIFNQKFHANRNGDVILLSGFAKVVNGKKLLINEIGLPENFRAGEGELEWVFDAPAGNYQVSAISNRHWSQKWCDGIIVELNIDKKSIIVPFNQTRELDNVQKSYHPESYSELAKIKLTNNDTHTIRIKVVEIKNEVQGNTLTEDLKNRVNCNLLQLMLKRCI